MKTKFANKIFILIPIISMGILGVTGCKSNGNNNKPRITYGTLVDEGVTKINYAELQLMVANNENFFIAIHQDLMGGAECGCWTTFKAVMNQYVKQYQTKIYYIDRSEFAEDSESFGLSLLNGTTNPVFALVKEGKKVNEYIYGKNTKPLFETVDGLRKVVEKIARDPQFLYVNQSYLDNALFEEKKDKVLVYYLWSFCPDCNDVFPRVLEPYGIKNNFSTKMWLIDIGIPGLLLTEDGQWGEGKSNPSYIEFLKTHHMSGQGDAIYGYDRGFVPTFQIWEKGELKDSCTYFNDEIIQDEKGYKINRSFYSEERVQHLGYTNTVLEGMYIGEEEVDIGEDNSLSWKKDYAAKKHQPLLEAFLDKYAK